jgi:hypothetical protein
VLVLQQPRVVAEARWRLEEGQLRQLVEHWPTGKSALRGSEEAQLLRLA